MAFPKLDHPISAERIALARTRHDGEGEEPITSHATADGKADLSVDVKTPVTTIWLELHPRPSELKAEQVREYLEHLNIERPEDVLASWQKKNLATAKYRYVKYAKTFVRMTGAGRNGGSWAHPTGMRLELVPQNDPTRVAPGQTLVLKLLENGEPLKRYPVSLVTGGTSSLLRTDDKGIVAISVVAKAPHLVRATTLVRSAAAGYEWDVHFTTLTFDARDRDE